MGFREGVTMSLRFSVSSALSVAAMFASIALLWGQAPQAAVPESRTALKAAKAWTVPRTPGGHPDFQGYWTNSTYTPLERPAALGTKEFYTEAEELALVRRLRLQDNSQPKDDIHYDNRTWQDESYPKGISNHRTSLIFDPPDGRLPPLNAKGQQHAAEFAQGELRRKAAVSAQSMSLAERCITWGTEGPPMINSTYNANLQIFENDNSLAILHEMIHSARMIPFDGRPHLPESVRQLGGDSRGQWEGDTLVVDTTNFTDKTPFRGPPSRDRQDVFSSEDLHVIERFTRVDADTILYKFT